MDTHGTLGRTCLEAKDNKTDAHWALDAGEAGSKEIMCHPALPKIHGVSQLSSKALLDVSFVADFKSWLCLGRLPMSPKRSISRFCELSQ